MRTPSPGRRRKRNRLSTYDYGQPGAYFVTICTHQRRPIFGHVQDGRVILSAFSWPLASLSS